MSAAVVRVAISPATQQQLLAFDQMPQKQKPALWTRTDIDALLLHVALTMKSGALVTDKLWHSAAAHFGGRFTAAECEAQFRRESETKRRLQFDTGAAHTGAAHTGADGSGSSSERESSDVLAAPPKRQRVSGGAGELLPAVGAVSTRFAAPHAQGGVSAAAVARASPLSALSGGLAESDSDASDDEWAGELKPLKVLVKAPRPNALPPKTMPIWRPPEYDGWTPDRQQCWDNIGVNPHRYFYRYTAPGVVHNTSEKFSPDERKQFFRALQLHPVVNEEWGFFSMHVPGRTGAQCHSFYQSFVRTGSPPPGAAGAAENAERLSEFHRLKNEAERELFVELSDFSAAEEANRAAAAADAATIAAAEADRRGTPGKQRAKAAANRSPHRGTAMSDDAAPTGSDGKNDAPAVGAALAAAVRASAPPSPPQPRKPRAAAVAAAEALARKPAPAKAATPTVDVTAEAEEPTPAPKPKREKKAAAAAAAAAAAPVETVDDAAEAAAAAARAKKKSQKKAKAKAAVAAAAAAAAAAKKAVDGRAAMSDDDAHSAADADDSDSDDAQPLARKAAATTASASASAAVAAAAAAMPPITIQIQSPAAAPANSAAGATHIHIHLGDAVALLAGRTRQLRAAVPEPDVAAATGAGASPVTLPAASASASGAATAAAAAGLPPALLSAFNREQSRLEAIFALERQRLERYHAVQLARIHDRIRQAAALGAGGSAGTGNGNGNGNESGDDAAPLSSSSIAVSHAMTDDPWTDHYPNPKKAQFGFFEGCRVLMSIFRGPTDGDDAPERPESAETALRRATAHYNDLKREMEQRHRVQRGTLASMHTAGVV